MLPPPPSSSLFPYTTLFRSRVFEPFFTTKGEAGTGLGLAISSGLVKAMSGRMYIHNVEGAGARLVVELPSAPVSAQPEVERPARAVERPLSVLIVEDEETVRRGMRSEERRVGKECRRGGW